jgi:O-Antigen ligase
VRGIASPDERPVELRVERAGRPTTTTTTSRCPSREAFAAVTARYGAPQKIASNAWDSFTSPPAAVGDNLTKRLFNLSANGRIEYAKAAAANYREHPVLGSGAGTYEQALLLNRNVPLTARDAHNLYLETLSELGPIGLGLVVLALAAPLAAAVSARRHPLATGAVAAYVAFLVHAAVDWDWEQPAVTVTALFLGVSLLALARSEREPRPLGTVARGVGLAALVAVSAFAFVGLIGNSYLSAAREAAAADRSGEAMDKAAAAKGWAPWSSEPWEVLGEAQLSAGQLPAARRSLGEGIERDPRNFDLWLELMLASDGGQRARAQVEAHRLNPLSPELAALERAAP